MQISTTPTTCIQLALGIGIIYTLAPGKKSIQYISLKLIYTV